MVEGNPRRPFIDPMTMAQVEESRMERIVRFDPLSESDIFVSPAEKCRLNGLRTKRRNT